MFGEKARLREINSSLYESNEWLHKKLNQLNNANLKKGMELSHSEERVRRLISENELLRMRNKSLTDHAIDKDDLKTRLESVIRAANKEIDQMQFIMGCLVNASECEAAIHERRTLAREQIIATVLEHLGEEIK